MLYINCFFDGIDYVILSELFKLLIVTTSWLMSLLIDFYLILFISLFFYFNTLLEKIINTFLRVALYYLPLQLHNAICKRK